MNTTINAIDCIIGKKYNVKWFQDKEHKIMVFEFNGILTQTEMNEEQYICMLFENIEYRKTLWNQIRRQDNTPPYYDFEYYLSPWTFKEQMKMKQSILQELYTEIYITEDELDNIMRTFKNPIEV